MKFKAIDFFCGAGGVTRGFLDAGINVLGGIDIDPKCKETYEKNNNTKFLNIDITTYPKQKLQKDFSIQRNDDSLIFIGCSPCQYYSKIKTNKKKSEHTRYLLADFQSFVEYYQPGYVLIENVPGIENKIGSPLQKFKKFLTENSYYFDDNRLNAKNYGVPQNRLRYILIASRLNNDFSLEYIEKTKEINVQEAIGDYNKFPPIPPSHVDSSDYQHSTAILSELNLLRLRNTPHNGGDKRDWPEYLLPNSSKDTSGHYDVYGRMRWDKPSPTITTKFRSLSNGRFGHPEQDRAISLREGATLQSFNPEYVFHSNSQMQIAKMIGNAVPPKLAESVGKMFYERFT